ncbi:sensor histidine kinase [Thomasclavelia sp.]|uniref:sensor histidine kinase n=1 Tax=Thomasclavelia sp. TaxID=3025757 RepID=UPI0025CFA1C6|nr:sensor histidine kinase [Thomasclavelia sp.]
MKLRHYLKDQIISIVVVVCVTFLSYLILWAFNVPSFLLVYIPSLFAIASLVIFCYDYYRKARYYNTFLKRLNDLDQKYLITELVKKPNFLEGKIMIESIYEIDKSMKEHINEIIRQQSELKEYIEMWCHEVKTPLATSLMIAQNNSNPVTLNIEEELVKIENYLEQVLFYARSENVEKDYLIKKIVLSDVVNAVIKRNKKDLITKRIKIGLNNLGLEVYSDKKWLAFILNQIINNAIKYSASNPMITITANKCDEYVELAINDNGIGILEDEIDRVFDKGFTGTNGRSNHKSTGIGLYLCKKLCLRLNHEIKITSNRQGTTVTIIFPSNSYLEIE